jgi:hypothetical protein
VGDTDFQLPFHENDLRLLSVEKVAVQLRASRAFIRLCVECGCPTYRGRISAAKLLQWLFEHYESVRYLSGMDPLAEVDGIASEAARVLKMGNAVITLLEFGASRASDSEEKWQLQETKRGVLRSLDRK